MLDGKQPMVFEADSRDQIQRALDFAADFKLKPMILGGKDAWKVTDRPQGRERPGSPPRRVLGAQ